MKNGKKKVAILKIIASSLALFFTLSFSALSAKAQAENKENYTDISYLLTQNDSHDRREYYRGQHQHPAAGTPHVPQNIHNWNNPWPTVVIVPAPTASSPVFTSPGVSWWLHVASPQNAAGTDYQIPGGAQSLQVADSDCGVGAESVSSIWTPQRGHEHQRSLFCRYGAYIETVEASCFDNELAEHRASLETQGHYGGEPPIKLSLVCRH